MLLEYKQTLFIPKCKDVEWPENFWIITACDPYSVGIRTCDDYTMKQLRQELSHKKFWKNRITGIPPDWKRREASFAVGGFEEEEVLEIGRRYGQTAVFRVQGDRLSLIACEDGVIVDEGKFRERLRLDSDEPRYRIYPVLLESGLAEKKRFIEANPNYQIRKRRYYVGVIGKTPDERLGQHKNGHKSCSYVTNYGIRLELEKFESIPLLNHADAVAIEVSHANFFCSQGYGALQK